MGCKASKEANVLKPLHNDQQRRSRPKINLDFVPDSSSSIIGGGVCITLPPPLQESKLGGNNNNGSTSPTGAPGATGKEMPPLSSTFPSLTPAGSDLSHTPAVTPQASWTAESRRSSSRTTLDSTRGYSEGGDGSSRRREGSRRRAPSIEASSARTSASRENGSDDETVAVANRERADTGEVTATAVDV